MNPLKTICFLMGVFALAGASKGPRHQYEMHSNRISDTNSLKPSDWLPPKELEAVPSLDEVSFDKLEHMSLDEGEDILTKIYHLAKFRPFFEPNFVLQPSNILVYWCRFSQRVSIKFNEFPQWAERNKEFGKQEVTFFITGLPQVSETTKNATRTLIRAYMRRYNRRDWNEEQSSKSSSSEEDKPNPESTGDFVVIDMGSAIPSFSKYATLDVERTGAMFAEIFVELIKRSQVTRENMHVIGSNMGANVAGAAARHYASEKGLQWRHITGLDPSKIYARKNCSLTGLSRGDAQYVDSIHSSAYGLGTTMRSGNTDFWPNGPAAGVPGAYNVVEASMRAIHYYAESVMPGNSRNFPAVRANSMKEYHDRNCNSQIVYMGVNVEFDVEGDFFLNVNAQSPFGRKVLESKQNNRYMRKSSWQDY